MIVSTIACIAINLCSVFQTSDTSKIPLDSVTITAYKQELSIVSQGFTDQNAQSNLANTLFSNGFAVLNYGTLGNIASSRIAGHTASRTAVLWNGFQINSISLGQADLSLIPSKSVGSLNWNLAANGNSTGKAAIAGAILVESFNAKAKSEIYTTWSPQTIGIVGGQISKKIKNTAVQLQAELQNSEGRFQYKDVYKIHTPELRLEHNVLEQNWMQVQIQNSNKRFEWNAAFFALGKRKQLDILLGNFGESYANQSDSVARIYNRFLYSIGNVRLQSALFAEVHALRYTDMASDTATNYSIYSRIVNKQLKFQQNAEHTVRNWKLTYVTEFGHLQSESQSHTNGINSAFEWSITQTSLRDFGNKKLQLGISALGLDSKWKPQAQALWNTEFKNYWNYSLQIATVFRFPTMNDRFWGGVGNPNLLPEEGYKAIGKLQYLKQFRNSIVKIFGNSQYTQLHNGLLWQPNQQGIWRPINVEHTRNWMQSLEFKINSTWRDISISNSNRYALTHAFLKQNEDWVEAIYVSRHTVSSGFDIDYKKLSLNFNAVWRSKQYTDFDLNENFKLAPYSILNGHLEYHIPIQKFNIISRIQVQNILNSSYQVIRAYPQAMRYATAQITIQF